MQCDLRALGVAYLSCLGCFLAMDVCWLTLASARLYEPLQWLMAAHPNWGAAALFYVLYVAGLLAFAVEPALAQRRVVIASTKGAMVGLLAYATYDLTNQAVVRDWPWSITLADLAWGTVVSGCASSFGAWIGGLMGYQRFVPRLQTSRW